MKAQILSAEVDPLKAVSKITGLSIFFSDEGNDEEDREDEDDDDDGDEGM